METQGTKYTKFVYTFKHNFRTTWEIIRDLKQTNRMCNKLEEGFITKFSMKKLSLTYEVGSEFEFIYKGLIKVYFTTLEIAEKENCAKIHWLVKSPGVPDYDFCYTLIGDVTGYYCTLLLEQNFSQEVVMLKEDMEKMKQERYSIFKNIEKCIEEEQKVKTQSEEILVEKDINFIWDLIVNFKEFHKLIPCICDAVEYEGETLSDGLKVVFKWNLKNNAIAHLIVKNLEIENNNRALILQSQESYPPIPKQTIEWSLERVEDNKCIVKLTHMYKEFIKRETLEYTSKIKKKILENLKLNLEDVELDKNI